MLKTLAFHLKGTLAKGLQHHNWLHLNLLFSPTSQAPVLPASLPLIRLSVRPALRLKKIEGGD